MDDNVLWLNKLVPRHVLLEESEIEKIKAEYGIEDSEIVDISKKNEPEPTIDHSNTNDDDLDAKQENDQNPQESSPE